MAMTASPTPLSSNHFNGNISRHTTTRQALRQAPARPHLNRTYATTTVAQESAASHARHYSLNDSSDDEFPMPMKLSALTKALLNDEVSLIGATSPVQAEAGSVGGNEAESQVNSGSPQYESRYQAFSGSPRSRVHSPFPRRVVRLSGTPGSSGLRRTTSLSSAVRKHNEQFASNGGAPLDLSTPAPVPRTVRIPITSSANHGTSVGSSGRLSSRTGSGTRQDEFPGEDDEPATATRGPAATSHGSVSRYASSTMGRARYGDDTGMQSVVRVKRLGKVAGTFLSGPARRGRRRQSEEEQDDQEEGQEAAISGQEPQSQMSDGQDALSSQEHHLSQDSKRPSQPEFLSGSPLPSQGSVNQSLPSRSHSPVPSSIISHPTSIDRQRKAASPTPAQPIYRLPAARPVLPSAHDQENEAPPTFKRNKGSALASFDKLEKIALRPQSADLSIMRSNASPERKPLAPRSQNTPHRPAPPPPPKMSILETATATAGAATTSHASKKRNNIRVNGKSFTRMEIVGRGGSSKVWRVMAENGKVYALKRVSLEDADESAVRGYKGEINLLKKLEGNDRVVRMLDFELNDEKQTLSVLMEMGELDFNKILTLRFNAENAKFDPSFTRHYWKEMLECIKAVHDNDVVHSDLKPANFVLVQGRLKLIDFGIANAIQTDETVNVHRDTQVGTPNYMSPESLMDANELPHLKGTISNQPKVMKLGKPSDIWSLGCILYQMSYGRQPFAHIQNQMARCRAIIDWNYSIEYPSHGVGGVSLPRSLVRTMKKCLNRDQFQRPTVEELLDDHDPFLNPVECDENAIPMTEELLGRILQNVVNKCKDRPPTDVEVLSLWPAGYFASLKKSLNSGS